MIMKKTLLKLISGLSLVLIASTALASGGGGGTSCDPNSKPIVFVHGWNGGNFNWTDTMARLEADGHPSCSLYGFEWSTWFDSNASAASKLADFVADVRADHNNQKVTIISHSNGGLITRQFRVFENGYAANDRFISLGAPHNGTTWAYACFNPSCTDMRPGSNHIAALAGQGCDRSLWSVLDGVILPYWSAQCGTNTQISSVDHLTMLWWPAVYPDIRDNL